VQGSELMCSRPHCCRQSHVSGSMQFERVAHLGVQYDGGVKQLQGPLCVARADGLASCRPDVPQLWYGCLLQHIETDFGRTDFLLLLLCKV
jgi:hypothetical protein